MTITKILKVVSPNLIAALLLSVSNSAQSTSGSRPTLDSFDLLTVNKTSAKPAAAVFVDRETFKVLTPLMDLSRQLENDYRAAIIEKKRTVRQAEYLDWLSVKTMSIYRSMLIIKELDNVPDEVCDLLTNDHELVLNIARVIGTMRLNARSQVRKEIDELIAKYNVPTSETRLDGSVITDVELLVDVMFRRLNADFARITPK